MYPRLLGPEKNDTPHLLDLVLTNNDFVRDITHMSPLGNSDHNICLLYTSDAADE